MHALNSTSGVVVDDAVAFVGGVDLTKMRWDTTAHAPRDPRRIDPFRRPYRPFHDVQIAVGGDPAEALGEMIRSRWRSVTGVQIEPPGPNAGGPSSLSPDLEGVRVAIARTEPAHEDIPAVREVEALHLDSIAAASRNIYMENQWDSIPNAILRWSRPGSEGSKAPSQGFVTGFWEST